MTADLFAPYEFSRGPVARNRLTVAPMTNRQSNPDGTLGQAEFDWLTRRAAGGFGLVMTCAAHVSPAGQGWANELGAFDDSLIPGLARLAAGVREQWALAIAQINHAGARSPIKVTGLQPVSASEYEGDFPGFVTPHALTIAEIEQTVADFAAAASRAARAGFDGIEIHGANGYLITQFISQASNHRTDAYGGSLANRARLVREILAACRAAVPASFLVGVRLSSVGEGFTVAETTEIAGWLGSDGADFLDLSGRDALPSVAEKLRELALTTPVIAGNGVWTAEDAGAVLAAGAQLVFLGSAAIGNPDWPLAARESGYEPVRRPFTRAHLRSVSVSEGFVRYLNYMPGMVAKD